VEIVKDLEAALDERAARLSEDHVADKNIVIWGAGRIGRGFVADLFHAAGYHIILVDQSPELVTKLRQAGRYTVVRAESAEKRHDQVISGYLALSTTQTEELAAAVAGADIMVVAVFPQDFPAVVRQLVPGLLARRAQRPESALDIILCTNLSHAAVRFATLLRDVLPAEMQDIGIVESLVIRMVAEPPPEERQRDPLLVWTNGFSEFPVDRHAFKGDIPQVPGLRLVDDMRAEEIRKLYTYNTCHAALAYLGDLHGYDLVVDCLADPDVRADAEGALGEASLALQAEYAFSADDMARWIQGVLSQTNNPMLGDRVSRYGADPRRKLKRADRLVGPALLARQHGIQPIHLVSAIAAGFLFHNPDDPGVATIQERITQMGIKGAVREVCELTDAEDDLVTAIVAAYRRLLEEKWADLAQQAGELGFAYEKTYHGCGQCVLAAILETIGQPDESAFRAATALAGGLGMVGDSTCAALIGGTMAFGMVYPRRRDHFDGDRENKYRTYDMAQRLRQRYLDTYGSTICHDIHRHLMGRAFNLLDPAERGAFEAAGAHDDKCTNVVAQAARWAVEIIGEESIEDAMKER
jgi:mannitol-1-phosphate 5-dehydrogenase